MLSDQTLLQLCVCVVVCMMYVRKYIDGIYPSSRYVRNTRNRDVARCGKSFKVARNSGDE